MKTGLAFHSSDHDAAFASLFPSVRHEFVRAVYERLGISGVKRIPVDEALYLGAPRQSNLEGERGNAVRDLMFATGVYAHEIPLESVEAAVAHVRAAVQELDAEKLREELNRVVQASKRE